MVVLRDLFECLTRLDKNAATVPGAAESWTTSEDGRVYTFKLRPNLRWSNGDAVVAEDFVAGLRRLVDPATASQYAQVIAVILNAPDIVAGKQPVAIRSVSRRPTRRTVVITLSGPAPYLPGLMAHPSTAPLHRPSFAKLGERFARAGEQVSNGAFALAEWVQGNYIIARRNTHYWNNAANRLDAVKYLQIADENAELRSYRAGELHCTAVVPRGQFGWIQENLKAELHVVPQLSTYYFGFNLDRPLFGKHPKIRRALSMVIDRERLANSVLRVGELPAYSWVPPGVNDYTAQTFDYANTPMAERITRRANCCARRVFEGETAVVRVALQHRRSAHEGGGDGGLDVERGAGCRGALAAVEFKSLLQDIDRREVDVFRMSWIGDYNDPYTFLQYLQGGFGINLPRYSNAHYDALLADAARQIDPPGAAHCSRQRSGRRSRIIRSCRSTST